MPVLPMPVSSFVGRDEDVEELVLLLSVTRLVTLCGTGGIGKTRLALSVAARSVDLFGDGVWVVELADLENIGALAEHVAGTLRLEPSGPAFRAVVKALSPGRQLLVLDNCEHVIGCSADLTDRLLAACPGLTILTTSREPLRVTGETIWRVPPLALMPGPDGHSAAETLFVERVRSASPGLTWSAAESEAVRALCADLEGIPLAIELAAAMARVLSVGQIRARLTDRFQLLSSGPRTAPERQRTLQATVEWSYETLSEDGQRLLQQLSVFRGGWTLDIAEEVCEGVGDVLNATAELVDKSLIQTDGQHGGEFCYRMLDTIRDYARQRLCAENDETALRVRHLECCAAMAVRMAELSNGRGPEIRRSLNRYLAIAQTMQPNIFAALHFAATEGRAEAGLRILATCPWNLLAHGVFEEYTKAMDRLLPAAADAPPGLIGTIKALRAMIALFSGDFTTVVTQTREALPLCREPGGRSGLLMASVAAAVSGVPGGLPLEEAYAMAEADGDIPSMAGILYGQALVAQLGGRSREAGEHYERMLLIQGHGNDWGPSLAELGLARLAENNGDLAAARRHYETAHGLLNDPEFPLDIRNEQIRCLTGLGRVALEDGDLVTAGARLREGLHLSQGLGARGYAAELVETIALLTSREGDHARAVPLAAAASALRKRMGVRDFPGAGARAQRILEPAAAALGSHEANRLWTSGGELPWNRVIDSIVTHKDLPVSAAVPVKPTSTLTERETEVARLVSRGLSNRRVAEELVISQATVARHVSNILTKLGYTSRAQIATWVAERHG